MEQKCLFQCQFVLALYGYRKTVYLLKLQCFKPYMRNVPKWTTHFKNLGVSDHFETLYINSLRDFLGLISSY